MPAPTITPYLDDVDEGLRALERYLANAAKIAAPAAPAAIAGAGPVLAFLAAASLWWLPGREALSRKFRLSVSRALEILTAVEELEETIAPGYLGRALQPVSLTLTEVRRVLGEIRRALPEPKVIGPSPQRLLTARMDDLRESTAALEFWRRQHTSQVHRPIRVQWERYAESAVAQAVAARTALAALGGAVHTIVEARLPDLARRLRRTVAAEAQARRAGDTVLQTRLSRAARTLRAMIAETRAWVATEVVPELHRAVETEGALRLRADRTLQRGLATEAETRTEVDLQLQAKLAPIAAWMGSIGLHTTTKVHRMEPTMDRLLSTRGDWARHLLLPPAFAAVAVSILRRVAPAIPEALVGLERAALAYLGRR